MVAEEVLYVVLWELPGLGMQGMRFFPGMGRDEVETAAMIIAAKYPPGNVKILEVTGGTTEAMIEAVRGVMPVVGGDGASLMGGPR